MEDQILSKVLIEDPLVQSSINISDIVSNIILVKQIEDLESCQILCNIFDNIEVLYILDICR